MAHFNSINPLQCSQWWIIQKILGIALPRHLKPKYGDRWYCELGLPMKCHSLGGSRWTSWPDTRLATALTAVQIAKCIWKFIYLFIFTLDNILTTQLRGQHISQNKECVMQRIILIAAGFCGMPSYSVITVLITSNSMRPHLLLFFWLQKQYMLPESTSHLINLCLLHIWSICWILSTFTS